MRTIKFRAWDNRNKRMIYKGLMLDQEDCYELSWPQFNPLEIELMQFTGLKDKNGKEIYEGDILATLNKDDSYDLWGKEDYGYTIVEWDNELSCFTGSDWTWEVKGDESVYAMEFVEVIGNIFEHPHLLKIDLPSEVKKGE